MSRPFCLKQFNSCERQRNKPDLLSCTDCNERITAKGHFPCWAPVIKGQYNIISSINHSTIGCHIYATVSEYQQQDFLFLPRNYLLDINPDNWPWVSLNNMQPTHLYQNKDYSINCFGSDTISVVQTLKVTYWTYQWSLNYPQPCCKQTKTLLRVLLLLIGMYGDSNCSTLNKGHYEVYNPKNNCRQNIWYKNKILKKYNTFLKHSSIFWNVPLLTIRDLTTFYFTLLKLFSFQNIIFPSLFLFHTFKEILTYNQLLVY